jgi:flagellar biosynthetic protein FliR
MEWTECLERMGPAGAEALLPIAARIGGVLLTVPVFSSRLVPWKLRLGLIAVLIPCVATGIEFQSADAPSGGMGAAPALVRTPAEAPYAWLSVGTEVLVGASLGWFVLCAFAAARGAAVFLSEQIGFSFGGVLDPSTDGGEPALRTLHAIFASYLFLSMNLHHVCLRGIAETCRLLPPGTAPPEAVLVLAGQLFPLAVFHLFELAVLLAIPVMAVLLLATLAQGAIVRAIPEVEFFVFGFPLRVLAGVGATAFALPMVSGILLGALESGLEEGRLAVLSLVNR